LPVEGGQVIHSEAATKTAIHWSQVCVREELQREVTTPHDHPAIVLPVLLKSEAE
jgi:DTW domain-containing protein YfiP